MKRVTRTRQLELDKFRQAKWHKQVRRVLLIRKRKRIAYGARQLIKEIVIEPPEDFSFSRNYVETVQCLRDLRDAVLLSVDRFGRRRPVFIDIAKISEISVAAALVLAAEIDRWRRFHRKPMTPRGLSGWSPPVRSLLRDLGFFELLGVSRNLHLVNDGSLPRNLTILPMVASDELDRRQLSALGAVSDHLHNDPSIYEALVEAAYNAMSHAYPVGFDWRYQPVMKGWWATASLDLKQGCVKFIVYDQGVGIAETLPRWEGWEKVRGILAMLPFGVGDGLHDESNLIKAALEVDRTSLSGGHGQGLKDVVNVVEGHPGAEVRILSGRGSILYKGKEATSVSDQALHLGGTLIEWTIPVRTD